MRTKTALQNPGNPKASPNQPSGLIAKGQQPGESAQEKCALDNRSHRTTLQISCERKLTSCLDRFDFGDFTMRINLLHPQR